jgi:hypothetical protein
MRQWMLWTPRVQHRYPQAKVTVRMSGDSKSLESRTPKYFVLFPSSRGTVTTVKFCIFTVYPLQHDRMKMEIDGRCSMNGYDMKSWWITVGKSERKRPVGWYIRGDSNMTRTDLCVNWTLIVPVIFEPPCTWNRRNIFAYLLKARTVEPEKQLSLANGSATTFVSRQRPRNKQRNNIYC